jgi:hypothetical protein
MKQIKKTAVIATLSILSGCGIHYYDPETKTEHLFGFGHMVMKVQDAGAKRIATVTGYTDLGFVAGTDDAGGRITAGWSNNKNIRILEPDTAIELTWPSNDLLNVRIGQPFEGLKTLRNNNDKTNR